MLKKMIEEPNTAQISSVQVSSKLRTFFSQNASNMCIFLINTLYENI